jgi:peptidoglycan/LPS O-acetylase OafA/YrhL
VTPGASVGVDAVRPRAASAGPLLQVDVMKGLAILAVIVLHSVPKAALYKTFAVFHIWQAVPVFCILMGFTAGLSMRRRAAAGGWEAGAYLRGRLRRLGLPFGAAFLASLVLLVTGATRRGPYFGGLTALGYLPTPGPGNYFITLVFQFAALFPLLGRLYAARPGWTVAGCFGLDLAFQLAAPHVAAFEAVPYLYSGSVFRYLGAIGLGLWLSDGPHPAARRNRFLWVGCVMSTAYLAAFATSGYLVPWFLPNWKAQNLLAVFYPAVLVMLGMRLLPSEPGNRIARLLAQAGRASYHVFLFQILFFASGATLVKVLVDPGHPGGLAAQVPLLAAGVAANMAVCVTAGWILWMAERRMTSRLRVRAAGA